jgi:hypothetical protein
VDREVERIISFLRGRGVEAIAHLGGSLLDHLLATRSLLVEWNAPRELLDAALCHAAYGTDGFEARLLDTGERDLLADVIGAEAERLVYVYAACDRRLVYPKLGPGASVDYVDRFTGEHRPLRDAELRRFIELTFANEIDLAESVPGFTQRYGSELRELLSRCAVHASPSAVEEFRRVFG